jgi:hypothetical protein
MKHTTGTPDSMTPQNAFGTYLDPPTYLNTSLEGDKEELAQNIHAPIRLTSSEDLCLSCRSCSIFSRLLRRIRKRARRRGLRALVLAVV